MEINHFFFEDRTEVKISYEIWVSVTVIKHFISKKQTNNFIHSLQEEYRPMFAKVLMPSDPRQLCAVPSKLWHGVGFMK